MPLEIYTLKKELVIVKMHFVERVNFEICLLGKGNNFAMVFKCAIASKVLLNTNLLDNSKVKFKDTYFAGNFNFMGCFIAFDLKIDHMESFLIKIRVDTISLEVNFAILFHFVFF